MTGLLDGSTVAWDIVAATEHEAELRAAKVRVEQLRLQPQLEPITIAPTRQYVARKRLVLVGRAIASDLRAQLRRYA